MSSTFYTTKEYFSFCLEWNSFYGKKFQIRQDITPFPQEPSSAQEASHRTLLDILEYWFGKQEQFLLFHTTNSPLWWVVENELREGSKQLRGNGLLGQGFYLSPNPRTSFLYGTKSPCLFREKASFLVFGCSIVSINASQLLYGIDFRFHDRYTMDLLDKPLNANALQYIEIALLTKRAKSFLTLHKVFHVTGPLPGEERWLVRQDLQKILKSGFSLTGMKTEKKVSVKPFDTLVKEVPFQTFPGFGTVFTIQRFVWFVVFEGTIGSFLQRLQNDPSFVAQWQSLVLSMGTDIRIHFNRFSRHTLWTKPAKCFLVEGHSASLAPETFFTTPFRKEFPGPFSFLSISKNRHKPLLVIPPYSPEQNYRNIYQFAQNASPELFFRFFQYSSRLFMTVLGFYTFQSLETASGEKETMETFVRENELEENGCFLNFHGGSVGWLHLRIDKYPAYYKLEEYEVLETNLPRDYACPKRRISLEKKEEEKMAVQTEKKSRLRNVLSALLK